METGGSVHIWHYLRHRLHSILASRKSIGQAGWSWQSPGRLCFGFIFAEGSSQHEQSTPLSSTSRGQYWPIIFLAPLDGAIWSNILVPMMCPALAEQGARPWYAHGSRCFTFNDEWLMHLLLIPPQVPAVVPAPTTHAATGATSATSDSFIIIGQSYVTAGEADIAVLEDVADSDDDETFTVADSETSACTATSSSCSTTASASTARRNRWTKYNKKDESGI